MKREHCQKGLRTKDHHGGREDSNLMRPWFAARMDVLPLVITNRPELIKRNDIGATDVKQFLLDAIFE